MTPYSNSIVTRGDRSNIPETYQKLESERSGYLNRARDYAKFSLPYILPEVTPRSGAANQHGFQGIGAQAVNHLANKLIITLFPPQRSFFKLEMTEAAEAALNKAGFTKTDLSEQLSAITKRTQRVQEEMNSRSALVEAAKHLIISGNSCLYAPKDGAMQAIPLSNYVVTRSMSGSLLCLIVLQEKELNSFEPTIQALIRSSGQGRANMKPFDKVKLYTEAKLVGDFFEVRQSAFEVPLDKKPQRVKPDQLPWIPVRWNTCYGESYGRGLMEDHAGDFFVIEFLSKALARGMALMADVKYLVKPGSVTDIDALVESPTGEFITGNIDDVGVLQLDKYADFTPISNALAEYKQRIGQSFMMGSANRRDAERVTAYELRLDANELETSLGGIYSHLAQSLQRPLAYLFLRRVDSKIRGDNFEPQILTGLEALGRIGDLDKIAQFTEIMNMPSTWPEGLQQRVKWDEYARGVAASLSMELPWLKTQAELDAEMESNNAAGMEQGLMQEASKAAPELIKQQLGGK